MTHPLRLTEPGALTSLLSKSHSLALATDKESPGQKDPEETHLVLGRPVRKTGWGQMGGVGSQALRFWLFLLSDSAPPHSSPTRPQLRPSQLQGRRLSQGQPHTWSKAVVTSPLVLLDVALPMMTDKVHGPFIPWRGQCGGGSLWSRYQRQPPSHPTEGSRVPDRAECQLLG